MIKKLMGAPVTDLPFAGTGDDEGTTFIPNAIFDDRLNEMTKPAVRVYFALALRPKLTIKELCDRTRMSRSTVMSGIRDLHQLKIAIARPLDERSSKSIQTHKEISNRQRFRIFHRDNFKCRYCGRGPATHTGVFLHVDHVVPRLSGGLTVDENLATSCDDCNLGKGSAPLSGVLE